MTAQEAINVFKELLSVPKEMIIKYDSVTNEDQKEKLNSIYIAQQMAIKALETVAEMKKRNISTETILEYAKFEDECIHKGFTFKSLLKAREKQIPKQTITSGNFFIVQRCPVCDVVVPAEADYCMKCGQKIIKEELM